MSGTMRRREFLGVMGAVAAGLATAGSLRGAEGEGGGGGGGGGKRPPNIIFILADDLGWAELGCYGNTFNETPNLDKLAKQGMRFAQGYAAAPVCSPTRAAFLTGQCPARVGITDYLEANDPKFLPADAPTFTKGLKKAGYATGLIGKWHLMGSYKTRPGDPKQQWFDEVICSETKYIGGGSYFHPYGHLPGVEAKLPGKEYLTDRLALEAVEFIRRHKEGPFFLFLSNYAPHTALVGKPEKVAKYKAKEGAGKNRNNPALAAMLESIDEQVGQVMAVLEELKLENDTILVFTWDNGGETNVTTNGVLRMGKSTVYEGGIRVPMIVRWPGVAQAGAVCAAPVSTIDYLPTFYEAAGVKDEAGVARDGRSMAGVLRGEKAGPRTLYWYYPREKPHFLGGRSAAALREGDDKLIVFYDKKAVELYDLSKDPSEAHDLAKEQPEKAAAMQRKLEALLAEAQGKPAKP